ncbi:MAG: Splicing factor 1, partial [Paramarteilia canceri]
IFTNCLVCTICGAKGHLTQDCKFKDDTTELNNSGIDPSQLNSEYMSLMRELKVNESDIDPNKPSIQGQITNDVTVCNWQDLFAITPDMAAGFGMMQMPTAALESSMNLQQNPATLPSGNNHQFNA